jgi:ferredoxin
MKVLVDSDRCRGHGMCCTSCPEVFELTDHGYAVAPADDIPAALEDAVQTAIQQCPERAISIQD